MFQTDGIQLLPDTAEMIWGAIAFALLIGLVVLVLVLVVRTRTKGASGDAVSRLDDLERRVDRLERSGASETPTRPDVPREGETGTS